jgi:CRP-like cAMP-binding protein
LFWRAVQVGFGQKLEPLDYHVFPLYLLLGSFYKQVMTGIPSITRYVVWGADHVAYGPVELSTVVDWTRDNRITADSWLYLEAADCWQRADSLAQLRECFASPATSDANPATVGASAIDCGIKPGSLRRVKILADMSDEQLTRFTSFMEVAEIPQWAEVMKQGGPGDAMYLVLAGELRVRLLIAGKETILATLRAGEFFGEMALFDQGPRSADVVANVDSSLLKIPVTAFQRVVQEAPDLAAPFLLAIGRTLCARIRADNKRLRDSVAFARAAQG